MVAMREGRGRPSGGGVQRAGGERHGPFGRPKEGNRGGPLAFGGFGPARKRR
jgi:hypothetical protein